MKVETAGLRADGTASNRQSAIAYGLKRFFTGTPCRWGHVAERYTSSGGCIACIAEAQEAKGEALGRARKMLAYGFLPKGEAIQLGSALYCSGEVLSCGHAGTQLVVDDSCQMCNQGDDKERLDLAAQLLS